MTTTPVSDRGAGPRRAILGQLPRMSELTVTDDGPGIAPDLLPHLFERFVRADKSRSREAGSFGLGLSIAASIIEAHNGTIEATSDSGRTTFIVRLPTVEVRAQQVTST